MNGFEHGTSEWHAAQRAEQLREHTAGMARHKDDREREADLFLVDIGIQAMQKQWPARMARVNYNRLRDAMLGAIADQ